MTNLKYMQYNTDYISGVMSLREPQKISLKILEDILTQTKLMNRQNLEETLKIIHKSYPTCTNFERKFISLTFALATGVGKTRLMGAFISYLYTNYGIKNFFVVAPDTTIYEKLKKDLGMMENPKYVFQGLGCFSNPPQIIADDSFTLENHSLFESDITIYIYNISKFDKDNVKMKDYNEYLGMSFYKKLANLKDLVILMDESHHYRAKKGMEAINNLNPILGLELTATPLVNIKNKQIPFKNVVYEYPLSKAIEDGYTRVPYAVTRTDIDFFHFGDEALDKLMLNDGIKCHKTIKERLEFYAKVNQVPLVKPFMLVVCKDTNHAKKIEEYIKSEEFEYGRYKNKTITIISKQSYLESEINAKLLMDVEKVDNPVEIVIHVNMLKEGWDVNNLYTIVPLRTASSKILREQMVGRGLRLPYGKRTGIKEIDAVMLTAHDKFQEIIEEAQKGDSIFKAGNIIKAEDLEKESIAYTQLSLEYPENEELNKLIKAEEENLKNKLSNKISDLLNTNVENHIYEKENQKIDSTALEQIAENIEAEIKKEKDLGEIYAENKNPIETWIKKHAPKIEEQMLNKYILIPRIKTEREEGEFYFEDFVLDLTKFTQKPVDNKILLKNLIDSSDEKIVESNYIHFETSNPNKILLEELRSKPEIDYNQTNDLLFKLITSLTKYFEEKYQTDGMKNIVMMYKRELSSMIYSQMMDHFVRNEGLLKEIVYIDRKMNFRSNYKYQKEKNIFASFSSKADGPITSILFNGIKKGIFESTKFDSEPELILARRMESDDPFVEKWLRPSPKDFDITYNNGTHYEPDFVVETFDKIYMIEVKAEKDLQDKDVLAKKDQAIIFCQTVSEWAIETKHKPWQYVLIPANKITANSTMKYLIEQYKI